MKVNYAQIVLILAITLSAAITEAQVDSSAKETIQHIIQQETEAWNKGDAKGYSRYFASDGTFTNILGMFFTGKEEFKKRHQQIFTGIFRGTAMKQNIVSLKFVRPEVALVETLTWTSGFSKAGLPPGMHSDTKGRLRTRLLQVKVKETGRWKVVSYHNVEVNPVVLLPEPQ
ncbi:hypothetical protein AHMF7605_01500 [Adhaeribacter arboris]|uniref:DUF4440 domain-containing protein n=1 Tax=Adhaeribacter arboris TaxID=2072846 RepID=A0A2T2YA24_9BACT|nr:SgcJ/EcaC family oxidoreductase [Adhaeribacter arboris]PSR52288.1 hypothetical protein AHMF7605_01500 [Adhaeribacter arboris]